MNLNAPTRKLDTIGGRDSLAYGGKIRRIQERCTITLLENGVRHNENACTVFHVSMNSPPGTKRVFEPCPPGLERTEAAASDHSHHEQQHQQLDTQVFFSPPFYHCSQPGAQNGPAVYVWSITFCYDLKTENLRAINIYRVVGCKNSCRPNTHRSTFEDCSTGEHAVRSSLSAQTRTPAHPWLLP